MAKNDSSSSKTEHVSGPPILDPLLGNAGHYETTITDKDGNETKGYGYTPEEAEKDASKNRR